MNALSKVTVLLFFSALCCLTATAAEMHPMKMHRTQAGELDETGWADAKSTEGRFTVRMPMPFNDFTVLSGDKEDLARRLYAIGSKSQEGIKITAVRTEYERPDAASKQFEKIRTIGMWQQGSTQPLLIDHNGFSAVEQQVRNNTMIAYSRTILVGNDMIVMIIEFPSEQQILIDQIEKQFFNSLVVEQ